MRLALEARPWISERDKVLLLNRLTEVINYWQVRGSGGRGGRAGWWLRGGAWQGAAGSWGLGADGVWWLEGHGAAGVHRAACVGWEGWVLGVVGQSMRHRGGRGSYISWSRWPSQWRAARSQEP